jgi:hypothetical protein
VVRVQAGVQAKGISPTASATWSGELCVPLFPPLCRYDKKERSIERNASSMDLANPRKCQQHVKQRHFNEGFGGSVAPPARELHVQGLTASRCCGALRLRFTTTSSYNGQFWISHAGRSFRCKRRTAAAGIPGRLPASWGGAWIRGGCKGGACSNEGELFFVIPS